jgi:hypothetical protein
MSNENNEVPLTPEVPIIPAEGTEQTSEQTSEQTRAKTPLEMVRERQAQMRGHQSAGKRGSSETDLSGPAESYKRRMRQRKSG